MTISNISTIGLPVFLTTPEWDGVSSGGYVHIEENGLQVKIASGSNVGLAPGTVVGLVAGTTISLASGTLDVHLDSSSVVSLASGTTVNIASGDLYVNFDPSAVIGLVSGTIVGLVSGTTVQVIEKPASAYINTFDTIANLAHNNTSLVTEYVPTSSFTLSATYGSASAGPCKVITQNVNGVSTTTLGVQFFNSAYPNANLQFPDGATFTVGDTIQLLIKNACGSTQDVYGNIMGKEK